MKSRSHISLMFVLVGIMIAFISICPIKATENAEVINRPYYQTSTNSGTWVKRAMADGGISIQTVLIQKANS